jgi:hypothetical protein
MNFLMAALGGALAVLYGVKEVNAMLAVNIGASAPMIIKSLVANIPPSTPPRIG